MADVITPYTGARRLINISDMPNWINERDAERFSAYTLYENLYWTEPGSFKLVQRGKEENPIYIPSGRVIINTLDRYVGRGWAPMPDALMGTPEQQAAAMVSITALFRRERMRSQFESNKLFGIMRGDWLFYITANPDKPIGSRLKIRGIDPGQYVPLEDPEDADHIIGCDLVNQEVIGDTTYVRRTRYLKSEHPDHPSGSGAYGGPISYQEEILELENWEDPAQAKVFQIVNPPVVLPADITNLPVYHIKNFDQPQNPFGISEMRGIERIMAAVNQSITDEELALALEGLGMYASDKGIPKDPVTGASIPWQLGPGRVVHDDSFKRVNGVQTVGPFQDHLKYLHDRINEVTGASDVARGLVDVTVAESGVALTIRMGPIIDTASKRDVLIEEVMNNLLFDLKGWLKVYEGVNIDTTQMVSTFGPKMPQNNKERFDQLLSMYTASPPLITASYFRDACREMGIAIPLDVTGAAIADEQSSMNEVMDPYGARVNEEINNAGAPDGVE